MILLGRILRVAAAAAIIVTVLGSFVIIVGTLSMGVPLFDGIFWRDLLMAFAIALPFLQLTAFIVATTRTRGRLILELSIYSLILFSFVAIILLLEFVPGSALTA